MVKLIVSDFDGCLLDLKYLHYDTLNKALATVNSKFIITAEEHLTTFDGLSTKRKLQILADTKNFPIEKSDEINRLKQKFTIEALAEFTNINHSIRDIIKQLKSEGYLFYIASNAVRRTVEAGIKKLDIADLVDKVYSNEDTKNQKPSPSIYLQCMIDAGVSPKETVIIEDSKHGRHSASSSGAYVCDVDNSFDFTYDRIKNTITEAEALKHKVKWSARNSLNILLPCAGMGSRFIKAGYTLPKPLIGVNGQPMLQAVVENLNIDAHYIFIVQKAHYNAYNLGTLLPLIAPGCSIIQTNGITEGAACTTLLAKDLVDNDKHLLIANSDQFLEWDSCDFMYSAIASNSDGGILTFEDDDQKWSYARLNEQGNVVEVAEKKVISNNATVGIYYWNKGSEYIKYAEQMIYKNIRVNNEFYVCPVFNEAIKDNKKIKIYNVNKMWGLGTPEDLNFFLQNYK